ncbi:MAG TPA: phosphotransferase [Nocardioides sp.]|nr:phosphotransferase [Nocardioides sp.]
MRDTPELLRQFWALDGAGVTPLGGGMNSETWLVEHEGSTYVAKRVPTTQVAELVTGCEIAAALAQAGLVTGRPLPTTDGRLVLTEHGVALLEHVAGRQLEGETDDEQRSIAGTLAAVHVTGGPAAGPSTAYFMADWLSPHLPEAEAHRWLRPVIEAVRAETDPLTVTWSVVHNDPAPEAFLHNDTTGVTGLIDWSGATRGPVLYDVASAVMYLGGPDPASAFLGAYRAQGPLGSDELQWLDAFRRFRWAVQAAYFAWRLAANDLTGIAGQAENEKGLADARRGLSQLGLDAG